MCSIIGALLVQPSKKDLNLVKNVFYESAIRGLHATGLSVIKDKIDTRIEAVPSKQFTALDDLSNLLNEDGNLYLIGHCRYSTSDLEFNQPLYSEEVSIVHNGVITQELPENWNSLYGYSTRTKNDSELLLHTIESGDEPLTKWMNSSIAAIELHRKTKSVIYYRNGKRPIYHSKLPNGLIITSTRDIMFRASKGVISAKQVDKDTKMGYNGSEFTTQLLNIKTMDLQHVQRN